MIVALFEDENYTKFLPLTYTKPVCMLRSGMFTALERARRLFPQAQVLLFSRDYLAPALKRRCKHPINALNRIDEELLLVNGALVLNQEVNQLLRTKLKTNVAVLKNSRLAIARFSEKVAKKNGRTFLKPVIGLGLKKILKECKVLGADELLLMEYPWELIENCSKLMANDYTLIERRENTGTIDEKAALYGEKSNVYADEGSIVEAFVTLDVRKGPIYIGRNSVVQSGSRITGPAYIGDETVIASALVHEGCSIGGVCRVGGELEETIVHGYTNKHHLGYLGHSYIGEWVNIGAATTNSNLKNTYGTVNVNVAERKVDTKRTKVGCFIGDHAKTSIGTQIYTGRKIGVASHVHGFITEDVPSFTLWARSLGAKPVEIYLESVVETQKRVFARRGVEQTKEDIELLRRLFTLTAPERKKAGVVKGKFEL